MITLVREPNPGSQRLALVAGWGKVDGAAAASSSGVKQMDSHCMCSDNLYGQKENKWRERIRIFGVCSNASQH